jgi:hypothetical protein
MEAQELQQTIEALREALERAPSRWASLGGAAVAFRTEAARGGEALAAARARVEALVATTATALRPLHQAVVTEAGGLAETLAAVPAPASLEPLEVPEQLGSGALSGLEGVLSGLPGRLEAARDTAEQALVKLGHEAADTAAAIEPFSTLIDTGLTRAASEVEQARTTLTGRLEVLVDSLETAQQQALAEIQALWEGLDAAGAGFADRLREVREDTCRAQAQRILDGVATGASSEEQLIERALERLSEAQGSATVALHEAAVAAAEEREAMAPLLADLGGRLEPMRRALESVKEAAEEAGFGL